VNVPAALLEVVKEVAPKPRPHLDARMQIGNTGEYFEGRLYDLGNLHALCVRLVGTGDEEFPKNTVKCIYRDRPYRLPPQFQSERESVIARLKQEAVSHKSPFYDGPCVRLESYHANPVDATERKHLTLEVAPLDWFDHSVSDVFVQKMLAGQTEYRPSDFLDLARLSNGTIDGNKLSCILCTISTIFTSDGYVLVAKRGSWLSVRRDSFSSSVDENVHREKDGADDSVDLFHTVLRGIEEEVSLRVRMCLTDDAPRLLGIGVGLDELHPTLLFSVFLPLSRESLMKLYRENLGRDFQESRLRAISIENDWAEVRQALTAQPWEEAGRASIMRAIEFVEAVARRGDETCLRTVQRLARESRRPEYQDPTEGNGDQKQ